MKIKKAISERSSIRQYTDRIPRMSDIKEILEAAARAPSGLNNQPWKFTVLGGKKKDDIAKFTKYASVIKNAPLVICVFLDNTATYDREKDIMAIGSAIQNMLLRAHELGFGTCWLGEILNRRKDVQEYLRTDSDYELMACVACGYSNREVTKGCRKEVKSFII